MREVATRLRTVVDGCVPLLMAIDAEQAAVRPAPGKWSRKEILGHLIDSAGNNQQKFVRMLNSNGPLVFTGYAQDDWVAAQHYQDAAWPALIELWRAFNDHLAHVIEHADARRLHNTVTLDGHGPYRLDFVMTDYVEHMKHHLKAILPAAGLASTFANVYGA